MGSGGLLFVCNLSRWDGDFECQHFLGTDESGVHLAKSLKAPDHEARPNQEDQGQSDLRDDQ